ncbi:MAG: DNA polymerase III subunit gamma/tau, partial [Acidimicrobiales bacterium]
MAEQSYQSLYRRFRPQRFAEVRGQDHVVAALLGALRSGRVSHAYLFSGPRGTGKTSSARILAKALNCASPQDGEPCGACDSCIAVAAGTSLDVHELDAASHNGVEAMRELVARAPLGSPGRWKVYIVDEVHMLSTAASNALLKTLEEPPAHVVFVLATTDPHKVLPTITSRTQHLELRLLGPAILEQLVHEVDESAGLGMDARSLAAAVRRGQGSARDTLSALDQMVAAGGVPDEISAVGDLLGSLASSDAGGALRAVAEGIRSGRDPQRLATELVQELRAAFLSLMAPALLDRPDPEPLADLARAIGPAALVRAIEMLGAAQVDMREAVEPRAVLEVSLVRLTRPDLDPSPAAILERLERLERLLAEGVSATGQVAAIPRGAPDPAGSPTPSPRPRPGESTPSPRPRPGESAPSPAPGATGAGAVAREAGERPAQAGGGGVLGGGRPALGAMRRPEGPSASGPAGVVAAGPGALAGSEVQAAPGPGALASSGVQAAPGSGVQAAGSFPSRDDLVTAWGDGLLASLASRPRARFRHGRFLAAQDGFATFALPDETHRSYCEPCRVEVEAALSAHFKAPVRLRLVVDAAPGAPLSAPGAGGGIAPG